MAGITIIGAGSATLSFCARISQINPNIKIHILEAGKSFNDRLKDPTPENMICGWGGAALYSDRKFSGPPCGTGLRDTNIYELRNSYQTVINQLAEACKDEKTKQKFILLGRDISMYLKTDDIPMEITKKKFQEDSKTIGLKRYPSVVLDDINESKQIVDHYQQFLTDNIKIHYETKPTKIEKKSDGDYLLFTTNNNNQVKTFHTKYLILATGRFGGLSLNNIISKNTSNNWLKQGRVEFGVRLDLSTYPKLLEKIKKLQLEGSNNGITSPDIKYKLKSQLTIEGHSIDVEYRTFCVCLSKEDTGSIVASKDIATKLTTYSGSSSVSELKERGDLNHVIKASNMGIMIRLDSSQISKGLLDNIFKMCQYVTTEPIELDLENIDESVSNLEITYPKDLTYIIYHGICQMINHILDTNELSGTVNVYGACLEGTGIYPNVDKHTYQIDNGFFAMGDVVEHTRGLLQSMVMGDIVAKYVTAYQIEQGLKKTGILQPYQSLFIPACSYGQVKLSNNIRIESTIELENKIEFQIRTLSDINHPNMKSIMPQILERAKHLECKLYDVKHSDKMNSDSMGVIYELHNFFLDTKIYNEFKVLHYITSDSALQYIILCNIIDMVFKSTNMKQFLLAQLKDKHPIYFSEHFDELEEQLEKTLKRHDFKSCILSLRTRKSIKTRDTYVDIPVMQSAYKFIPITKKFYNETNADTFQTVKFVEKYLVSLMMGWIDVVIPIVIKDQSLSLAMVRSKIETQEPCIVPYISDSNPLYLECHVKVVMKTHSGEIPDYHKKSKLIQMIADAFEGSNAIEPDIFNILSVSINLLKHPDNHQQYFLTFRTHNKTEMELIRSKFNKIMKVIELDPQLQKYQFRFLTDSEFVVYDNNRPLDIGWFPSEKELLVNGFEKQVNALTQYSNQYCFLSSNLDKLKEYRTIVEGLDESQRFAMIRNLRLVNQLSPTKEYNIDKIGKIKAEEAYNVAGFTVLVEVTGMCLEGMDSFPGGQTKEIINQMGLENFAKTFNGKSVTMITGLYMCDGNTTIPKSVKKIKGTIVLPRGEGWGWDSIFQPNDVDKTFGEMDIKTKNEWSSRPDVLKLTFGLHT